jgi:SWI/SNF-related matrix-associated actin-dependent regulator of chromatin subfamily A3
MEPQWNEVIEEQAISRVIRLGQTKYVKVIRYCMKNSIEQVVILLATPIGSRVLISHSM